MREPDRTRSLLAGAPGELASLRSFVLHVGSGHTARQAEGKALGGQQAEAHREPKNDKTSENRAHKVCACTQGFFTAIVAALSTFAMSSLQHVPAMFEHRAMWDTPGQWSLGEIHAAAMANHEKQESRRQCAYVPHPSKMSEVEC